MKTKTENQLKALIAFCKNKKNRGAKSCVLRLLVKNGNNATWSQVSEWLHPDPLKRRVPQAGVMSDLLDIQKNLVDGRGIRVV